MFNNTNIFTILYIMNFHNCKIQKKYKFRGLRDHYGLEKLQGEEEI